MLDNCSSILKDQYKDDEAYDINLALELVNVAKLGLPLYRVSHIFLIIKFFLT